MCDECKVLKAKLQETVAEYRELLEDWREAYVRQGGIGYWDVLDRTRDALASGAGEKAAAVIAAARRYWVAVEEQDSYYEPDPTKNREYDVIRDVHGAHDGLLDAAAAMEKGADRG